MSDVKIRQIGHLAITPEVSYYGDADKRNACTNILVISNKRTKDRETGEVRERATRLRWTLWGNQAENAAKFLKKGSHVSVEGRLENNDYEKNGETIYSNNHVVEEIEYLDSRAESEARSGRSE
jgi:single-strand DNA-binding protein